MRTRFFCLALGLAACDGLADGDSRGEALATVHGMLVAVDETPSLDNVRIALVWYPQDGGAGGGSGGGAAECGDDQQDCALEMKESADADKPQCRRIGAIATDIEVSTEFPAQFSLDLTEPPPAEMIGPLFDGNGPRGALGALVVYEDGNGNGSLDLRTVDIESPDMVVGASVTLLSDTGIAVLYLADGPIYSEKENQYTGTVGYNLLQIGDPHDEESGKKDPAPILSIDTEVRIELTATAELGLMGCDEYCVTTSSTCPADAEIDYCVNLGEYGGIYWTHSEVARECAIELSECVVAVEGEPPADWPCEYEPLPDEDDLCDEKDAKKTDCKFEP